MTRRVTIIGGGIAGLVLALDLSQKGHEVSVVEKGNYPRHKVCGEYVSMESQRYLFSLCPSLYELSLPYITKFRLSSTGTALFQTPLDLGGFGISRYLLEELLFLEAKKHGAEFQLDQKVTAVKFDPILNKFEIRSTSGTTFSEIVCNATGRKSNLEIREGATHRSQTNYVGVKYHVRIDRDPSLIEIHNFEGGYCGISNIEENKSCLCYIVNSKQLKKVNSSISGLQENTLFRNEHLKKIFQSAQFIFEEPLTISGINFLKKEALADGVYYLGDAAGSIAPITGNGMSMGLRSAFVLGTLLDEHLGGKLTIQELNKKYSQFWNSEFSLRIKMSRYFQKLSEYPLLTKGSITVFNTLPAFGRALIRETHGAPF